ncbi:hypothetical protein DIPPA_09794 [Diplonema papillatum]|nr:hypothetical protein DIPPA_09794 [Diplonema papillatum]
MSSLPISQQRVFALREQLLDALEENLHTTDLDDDDDVDNVKDLVLAQIVDVNVTRESLEAEHARTGPCRRRRLHANEYHSLLLHVKFKLPRLHSVAIAGNLGGKESTLPRGVSNRNRLTASMVNRRP